jgi:S-adenosylmethionine:tRNA ribosyltransferase-isomerase
MLVSDFDFELPKELIAQEPPPTRGTSRLLVLERATGRVTHQGIGDLPAWLTAGDLLVLNDTKVFPARLLGHRVPSGGAVECLLLERLDDQRWDALMHPGQKLKPGARFDCGPASSPIHGEVVERGSFGRRTVRLWTDGEDDRDSIDAAIDAIGHMPLPPYIHRADTPTDLRRYQTVYARVRGSVAAPTAGLHFTPELLDALSRHGVQRADVTLHVGYGTFKPVRTEIVEDHVVDPERFAISDDTAARIADTKRLGRRVVAVGTTTVRALETAGASGTSGAIRSGPGTTALFVHPGHAFHVVDALLTNFHLPRSSLLMLVCAFAGRERVLAAYREAVAARYRFYSYGDAMLIV